MNYIHVQHSLARDIEIATTGGIELIDKLLTLLFPLVAFLPQHPQPCTEERNAADDYYLSMSRPPCCCSRLSHFVCYTVGTKFCFLQVCNDLPRRITHDAAASRHNSCRETINNLWRYVQSNLTDSTHFTFPSCPLCQRCKPVDAPLLCLLRFVPRGVAVTTVLGLQSIRRNLDDVLKKRLILHV